MSPTKVQKCGFNFKYYNLLLKRNHVKINFIICVILDCNILVYDRLTHGNVSLMKFMLHGSKFCQ